MPWPPFDIGTRLSWLGVLLLSALVTLLVGFLDYQTGIEYRVFPFYFLPISFAAWYAGRSGALTTAVVGAASWLVFNYLGGLRYSHVSVWAVNLVTQGTALALVGWLIATVRAALARETLLSRTDPMTGLLNSRAFGEAVRRELAFARRQGQPLTLAFTDIDGFKAVNDRWGHRVGDDVLCRVAAAVRETLRATDIAARLGGDEFAVLLPATSSEGAGVLLERLRSQVAAGVSTEAGSVTLSIGAITCVDGAADLDSLLQQADRAMYAAKASGKDRVRLDMFTAEA
ncbi:MAG: GGDEF domain-containing protein [Vicinamibacterales bacterium]|nr:GGDEF domain-containing protein [Vicinamibacterales bacterium]